MALTIKELKNKSKELKPVLQVGKQGITPQTVEHIKTVLKRHKLIKIKLLKSFTSVQKEEHPTQSPKELAQKIADLANANLIDQVGQTISLAKKNI